MGLGIELDSQVPRLLADSIYVLYNSKCFTYFNIRIKILLYDSFSASQRKSDWNEMGRTTGVVG